MSADTLVVIIGVAGAVMLAFAVGMWLAEARLRRRDRLDRALKAQQRLRDMPHDYGGMLDDDPETDGLITAAFRAYEESRRTGPHRRRYRDAEQQAELPMTSGEAARIPPAPGLWPTPSLDELQAAGILRGLMANAEPGYASGANGQLAEPVLMRCTQVFDEGTRTFDCEVPASSFTDASPAPNTD